jgi:hypothetical protein
VLLVGSPKFATLCEIAAPTNTPTHSLLALCFFANNNGLTQIVVFQNPLNAGPTNNHVLTNNLPTNLMLGLVYMSKN